MTKKRGVLFGQIIQRREIKRFTEKVYNGIVTIVNSIYELISIDIIRMQRLRKNLGLI